MTAHDSRQSTDIQQKLEVITNLAVLVAAVLVAGYFAYLFMRAPSAGSGASGPQPGMRLAAPDGHDFAQHDRTVVMVLSTNCSHCEADLPFYRELATFLAAPGCTQGLLAVFPNDEKEVEAFRTAHDFWPPSISGTPLATFGVSGTPTLMLVDSRGSIQRVWVGELSPEREQEVLEVVEPLAVCSDST